MPETQRTLVRIVAPNFVAGFETDGIVLRAAPIIKYLVGKSNADVRAYIKSKGWTASICAARPILTEDR